MKNTGRGHPWLTGDERKKAMKKVYSKPDIYYEDFSLSTNIAAGCEFKTDLQSQGSCGARWGNGIIFASQENGCNRIIEDNSASHDFLCYHNPNQTFNVFNS